MSDPTTRLRDLTDAVAKRESEYLDLLSELVSVDSGSLDHEGIRHLTGVLAGWLLADGFDVERIPAGDVDVLVARRQAPGPVILLNAHIDTVFDQGAAAERPFTITDGIARGPGVADDKCGIAAAIIAARALVDVGATPNLLIVLTPDEEIGSPTSAPITKMLAATADVALCLEAARASGALVSARKGGANMRVHITGRAAHSGVEPEKGINAALQMAHAIIGLQALNDPARGVTVNAGVASSGTRSNIVPAEAMLWIDLRAAKVADYDQLMIDVEAVVTRPYVEGIHVIVEREAEAPPMEATPGTLALADMAVEVAAELGFAVEHVATGGIGDANLVATAGIPVLDGLAPIGGDDHTPIEWLDVASIVPRVALLAGLIDRVSRDVAETGGLLLGRRG